MEKGETIDLGSLSKKKARKIIKKFFPHDFSPLKPRSIYRCLDCGVVVLRASLPDVEVPDNLNEEPYCPWCKIKNGQLKEVQATIVDI